MNNIGDMFQNIIQNSNVMQNPMMRNAMELYKQGDTEGLQKLVNNVAKQKGISIDDIRKNMGI